MLVSLAGICLGAGIVSARQPILLLIGAPEKIREAATLAMSDWHVVAGQLDRVSEGDVLSRVAKLARRHGAQAVAWMDIRGDIATLYIYDVNRRTVASRRLSSAPPYDDAGAVSVALTLKTLLRNGPTRELHEVGQPSNPHAWRLDVGAAVGGRFMAMDALEPRFSLSVAWPFLRGCALASRLAMQWPHAIEGDVPFGSFRGTLREPELGIEFQLRRSLSGTVRGIAAVGGALHLSWLAGTDGRVNEKHVNASLDFGVRVQRRVTDALRAELWFAGSWFARQQHYISPAGAIMDSPGFSLQSGLGLQTTITVGDGD